MYSLETRAQDFVGMKRLQGLVLMLHLHAYLLCVVAVSLQRAHVLVFKRDRW